MKAKYLLLLLCIFAALFSCEEDNKTADPGKDFGGFYISDATPEPGETLHLSFTSKNPNSKNGVTGIWHYVVGRNLYSNDLELIDSAGVWKASVEIPDSAKMVAFHFTEEQDFSYDGENAYVLPLFTNEGNPIPGSFASQGFYYTTVSPQFGLQMKKDSIFSLYEKDIKADPEIRVEYDRFYANLLVNKNENRGKRYLEERIAQLTEKEKLSEKEYALLSDLYKLSGEKELKDSIEVIASQKYPRSLISESKFASDFSTEKDIEQKKSMLQEYYERFGKGEMRWENFIVNSLASTYVKDEDFDSYMKITDQMSNLQDAASLHNNVAWELALEGEKLEFAENISKKSLELVRKEMDNLEHKPDRISQKEYSEQLQRTYAMYADTYAFILFKQGKVEEALPYQKLAIGKGKNAELNERYVQYLMEAGRFNEVLKTAENFIQNNTATAQTKEFYEQAFMEVNGSRDGLERNLKKLEEIAYEKAYEALKKDLIKKPSPRFSMKDLDGNEITLSSLKGKIVILDFWATWCGPCLASFPGMQKAVEKYKDDPEVAFLFVNTWESSNSAEEREEKLNSFIEKNNYTFHVLLDSPTHPGSNNFQWVEEFGINGIPTKIILGPDGNIRFKKIGYSGNNTQMIQEIDMMISLVKE